MPFSLKSPHRALACARLLVLVAGFSAAPALAWEPDLVVVIGRNPGLVLPASLLAARAPEPLPLLLVEPGRETLPAALIRELKPKRSLVLAPHSFSNNTLKRVLNRLGLLPDRLLVLKPERFWKKIAKAGLTLPSGPSYVALARNPSAALAATYAAGRAGGRVTLWSGTKFPGRVYRKRRAFASAGPTDVILVAPPGLQSDPRAQPANLLLAALEVDAPRPSRRVISNPRDQAGHFSPPGLSLLSPYVALTRGASLALVEASPEALARAASQGHLDPPPGSGLTAPPSKTKRRTWIRTLILVGDTLALPRTQIADPDQVWRGITPARHFAIPPLSGLQSLSAAAISSGRLTADDLFQLSLQLANQLRLKRRAAAPGRALMLSNVDLKFKLGEAISRATVTELSQVGLKLDARYGEAAETARKQGLLPGHDLVIWEGHPRDLSVDDQLGVREELLDAGLVVLQGCYTLERNDASVLGALGANAVLGTTMPVYSASGSAFAKVFLDAQIYHSADLGSALVHARNYSLAYLRLKQARGHTEWRRTWRAGLAFDLWGDPTARPLEGLLLAKDRATLGVYLKREANTLRFVLPPLLEGTLKVGRYRIHHRPGAELGAIYRRKRGDPKGTRALQEVFFAWIDLPDYPLAPALETPLEARDWVSVWAPQARRLYLLVHEHALQAAGADGLRFKLSH